MSIVLRQKTLFDAITRHIQLANKHHGWEDFTSCRLYNHHISSADALLRLAEKEVISKPRVAVSLRGLTKRLASLGG